MTTPGEDTKRSRPVQRFKPTSGFIVGYAGLVFVVLIVGYVAVSVHTLTGLRVALGMLLFGLLIWVTQLRSRATAHVDRLVLKNSLRDFVLPLVLVEEVTVRQTLNVWVGERRYVCVGIGSSLRSIFKESRASRDMSGLGQSRMREFAERAKRAAPDQSAMTYETFVVNRIEELVEQAKKGSDADGTEAGVRPVTRYAWPEIAALVVIGVAFVATLLV